jgi:hypothetical protein
MPPPFGPLSYCALQIIVVLGRVCSDAVTVVRIGAPRPNRTLSRVSKYEDYRHYIL